MLLRKSSSSFAGGDAHTTRASTSTPSAPPALRGSRRPRREGRFWQHRPSALEVPWYLVEVVEGSPELLHLLLADALGVAGEDLVLHLVDGAGDGGEELLPAHADVLEGERRGEGLGEGTTQLAELRCAAI